MKFRYAAALALLDWYLMTAPPPGGQPSSVQSVKADIKAPLSKWTIVGIFPSKKACEAQRGTNTKQRCFASEDPHFRDNNPPP
jgi:hypothetical protein